MNAELKTKLEKLVLLVNKLMVDPEVDIDYFIPGVEVTVKNDDTSSDHPYILLTYVVSDYNKRTRKIHLGSTALEDTAEDIANHVTASIQEFKGEIDSVEMG